MEIEKYVPTFTSRNVHKKGLETIVNGKSAKDNCKISFKVAH